MNTGPLILTDSTQHLPQSWHGESLPIYCIDNGVSFSMATGPESLFGHSVAGQMVTSSAYPSPIEIPHSQWYQQSVVLMLFLLYAYVLYRFRDNIGEMFKTMFSGDKTEHMIDSQNINLPAFLRLSTVLFILSVSLLIIVWLREIGVMPIAFYLVIPLILVLGLYRGTILRVLEFMSADTAFFEELRYFNKLSLSVIGVIYTPIAMVVGLNSGMLIAASIGLGILIIYHLIRINSFFVSKKVSILLWILYLCTAEVLPVSYLAIMGAKVSGIY